MLIYIIRHGETCLNVKGVLQGNIDEPLNENGLKLAEVTGEALKDIPFDILFTSPLVRARKTGELAIAASEKNFGRKIPVIEDDRLREIDWGCWDGMGCTAANFELPCTIEEFNTLFSDPYVFEGSPDGENPRQVTDRTQDFFQELIQNPEYEDKIIMISSHGCATKGLLNYFNHGREEFWNGHLPLNCEVNIIGAKDGRAFMIAREQLYYDSALAVDHYAVED